jgi:methyl-accepting chemotaxis protein
LNFSSQVDQEIEEVDVRTKEQANNIQQLIDDTDKMKSLSAKEMRLVHQQNQQNDRLNEEIRNVLNLTVFEEAKLARGQIDE